MVQSIATEVDRTAQLDRVEQEVDAALNWLRPQLMKLARSIQAGSLTPGLFFQIEVQLMVCLRDFGRLLEAMAASRYAIGGTTFLERTEARIEQGRAGRLQEEDLD